MRYYLDCEFNGMGGELLSLALVRENGEAIYLVAKYSVGSTNIDPWVRDNVLPVMGLDLKTAANPLLLCHHTDLYVTEFADRIEHFLAGYPPPTIISDWPDDIKYFCELMITGPGERIDTGGTHPDDNFGTTFEIHRVDSYPTTLPGAVQHNAYWDAMALRHKLQGGA